MMLEEFLVVRYMYDFFLYYLDKGNYDRKGKDYRRVIRGKLS